MTGRSRTELLERAEALDQRIDETNDFVTRQWKDIEDRTNIRRALHEEALTIDDEASEPRLYADRSAGAFFFALAMAASALAVGVIPLLLGNWLFALPLLSSIAAFWVTLFFESVRSWDATRWELSETLSAPLLLALTEIDAPVAGSRLPDLIAHSPDARQILIKEALALGLVEMRDDSLALTPAGRSAARHLKAKLDFPKPHSEAGEKDEPEGSPELEE